LGLLAVGLQGIAFYFGLDSGHFETAANNKLGFRSFWIATVAANQSNKQALNSTQHINRASA
jgi:hypothetical protein